MVSMSRGRVAEEEDDENLEIFTSLGEKILSFFQNFMKKMFV